MIVFFIVEQKNVFNVSGDEKTFQITFPENMPLGKYVFTVWGGLADETALKMIQRKRHYM